MNNYSISQEFLLGENPYPLNINIPDKTIILYASLSDCNPAGGSLNILNDSQSSSVTCDTDYFPQSFSTYFNKDNIKYQLTSGENFYGKLTLVTHTVDNMSQEQNFYYQSYLYNQLSYILDAFVAIVIAWIVYKFIK